MSLTNRRLSDKVEPMTGVKAFDFSGKVHGLHGRRRQGPLRIAGYALLLALGLYVGSLAIYGQKESSSVQTGSGQRPSGRRVLRDGTLATDTLVVYIFSNTDPEYIENLRFFAQFGMQQGDGCDYVVVVQEDGKVRSAARVYAAGEPSVRWWCWGRGTGVPPERVGRVHLALPCVLCFPHK